MAEMGLFPYQSQPKSKILVKYQPKFLIFQILILTWCMVQGASGDKMIDHIYNLDDSDNYILV